LKIERLEPSLPKERREKALPTLAKSSTESLLPTTLVPTFAVSPPKRLTVDPNLEKERREMEEPK
jgi:hypothetical protein